VKSGQAGWPTRYEALRIQHGLPDGQINAPAHRLSSPSSKNILIFRNRKSVYIHGHPASQEERFAVVTSVRRDAVDVDGASDESA
jgi:hypothetical protein